MQAAMILPFEQPSAAEQSPRVYVVETLIGFDWENCWTTYTEEKPEGFPTTYKTALEAQAAIDEHLADVKDAVAAGDMLEEYDRDDFRIVTRGVDYV